MLIRNASVKVIITLSTISFFIPLTIFEGRGGAGQCRPMQFLETLTNRLLFLGHDVDGL